MRSIVAEGKEDVVKVETLDKHTNIVNIEKNGNKLYHKEYSLSTGDQL